MLRAYRLVNVDDLAPYPRNARTHSDAQVTQLAASMREFGFTNPLLVDEQNGIIAGHARLLAARKLGMGMVPAIEVAGLSDAQKRALVLADNKLALNAGWDDDLLRLELEALKLAEFDLDLVGFSDLELAGLTAPEIDPEAEWQGMPEFEQADKTAWQSVTVHCVDQQAVEAFAALIGQPVTNKTRFVWFPRVERRVPDDGYAAAVSDLHSV